MLSSLLVFFVITYLVFIIAPSIACTYIFNKNFVFPPKLERWQFPQTWAEISSLMDEEII
jgi:hypothetical protein